MINLRGVIKLYYKNNSTWVDATNGLIQADITRGIPEYKGCWSQVSPGQLRIRTKNLDLDPTRNSSIALYSQIKITANNVAIFTGKLIDAQTDYFPKDDAILTLNVFDELGILALRKFGDITVINNDYTAKTIIVPTNLPAVLANNSGKMGESYYTDILGAAAYQTGYQNSGRLGYDNTQYELKTVGGAWGGWGSRIKTAPTLFTTVDPDGLDGMWADKPGTSAKPGFATRVHGTEYAEWCALTTTGDTDALTLFLKSEQSEAGFSYIDKDNKFIVMSRPWVDNNKTFTSKASFKSDGTAISYNNIKVTNGWESVVKGITISNTWSDSFCSWYENFNVNDDHRNQGGLNYYVPSGLVNRDGTTTTKVLNPSPPGTIVYPWLPLNTVEIKSQYHKYAKTNISAGSHKPIYDFQTRDWDVTKITSKSIFRGVASINGSNQLVLNTNYAMTGSTGGGYIYDRNGTITNYPATPDAYLDNVNDRTIELADEILSKYGTAVKDVRSISFDVHAGDIDSIASIDVFDRIDLNHDYSGYAVNKQYAVMGIKHTITPTNWSVDYELWNQSGRP